jgi:hypothetical protein
MAFLLKHNTDSKEEVAAVLSKLRKSSLYEMWTATNDEGSTQLSGNHSDGLVCVASMVIRALRLSRISLTSHCRRL